MDDEEEMDGGGLLLDAYVLLAILTADDYSLAIAEAGAFHADLLLQLDEHLQQGLNQHDGEAWALWNQVRSTLKFSADTSARELEPAANVAVIVDQLDPSDEVTNLLSRHNIPFQVFTAADLKTEELKGFDIVIVFAKPDAETVATNQEFGDGRRNCRRSGCARQVFVAEQPTSPSERAHDFVSSRKRKGARIGRACLGSRDFRPGYSSASG